MFLADTTLGPRLKRGKGSTFATTIGTPQGDSLSPVLFVIYLEAALRNLRHNLPQRSLEDINMPYYIAHADDVDFISNRNVFLVEVKRLAPGCLLKWHPIINESKTEHTNIHRRNTRDVEQRRKNMQTRFIASSRSFPLYCDVEHLLCGLMLSSPSHVSLPLQPPSNEECIRGFDTCCLSYLQLC